MLDSEYLKKIRLEKGYTQESLARILNITLKSYQNIEYNKSCPNAKTLLELCKILNIDPFKLYKL